MQGSVAQPVLCFPFYFDMAYKETPVDQQQVSSWIVQSANAHGQFILPVPEGG